MSCSEQNRENAQSSTGPRSDAGKLAVSRNALRHGLTAKRWPVLPDEQDAFEAHRAALVIEAAPVGALETALVEQVVLLLWRWRRCAHVEAALLEWHQYDALAEHAYAETHGSDDALTFALNPTQDVNAYRAAQDVQAEARNRQALDWPALGHGFAQDADGFATLSRYELAIEAALGRTLTTLRRLQAERCETNPPTAER